MAKMEGEELFVIVRHDWSGRIWHEIKPWWPSRYTDETADEYQRRYEEDGHDLFLMQRPGPSMWLPWEPTYIFERDLLTAEEVEKILNPPPPKPVPVKPDPGPYVPRLSARQSMKAAKRAREEALAREEQAAQEAALARAADLGVEPSNPFAALKGLLAK